MSQLKEWLQEEQHYEQLTDGELQSICDSLNSCDVGIKGSNVFSITYSFVANVITIFFA